MTARPDPFADQLMRMVDPGRSFKPMVRHDKDGDCIEFIASPGNFVAERVDDLVTVYLDRDTGELVGSLIKGASEMLRTLLAKAPNFRLEIEAGRTQLKHLFLARLWHADASMPSETVLTYRKLAEVAERTDAEAELDLDDSFANSART